MVAHLLRQLSCLRRSSNVQAPITWVGVQNASPNPKIGGILPCTLLDNPSLCALVRPPCFAAQALTSYQASQLDFSDTFPALGLQ